MAGEITLKVIEARASDVGRGIARVDPAIFREKGWQAGDVISIQGKKRTAALLWPGYPDDTGTGVIRLDGNIRRNADVSIDDRVPVRIIQSAPAESLVLAPTVPCASPELRSTFAGTWKGAYSLAETSSRSA